MKKIVRLFFISIPCLGGALFAQTPTWSENISCVLYTHCTNCHNDKGIAPFSLTRYEDVFFHRVGIRYAVNNRIMPPWPADNSYRSFAHERTLSEEEIQLINDWVDAGGPEGDPTLAPAPPEYSVDGALQNADLELEIPAFRVPESDNDVYRCFTLPVGNTKEQFIKAIEIIPGNRNIVHHVLVFQDPSNESIQLDNRDPEAGYTCFGGPRTNEAILIGGWVPGQDPQFFPEGMGPKLDVQTNLIIQVHYPEGSGGQIDNTRIRMLLTEDPNTREINMDPAINHGPNLENGPLFIPANSIKSFTSKFVVPADLTLFSVLPHMHLIGKSIKAYGVTFTGDTIPLVNIPEWDFHWQGAYHFKQPVKIPAWTTLVGEATYDNTLANPDNPNNPPRDISLGEATTDEMMLVYFSWALYENGDENRVIDTTTTTQYYNDCSPFTFTTTDRLEELDPSAFNVFPNPATHLLKIEPATHEHYSFSLYDMQGREVRHEGNQLGAAQVSTQSLGPGLYLLEVYRGTAVMRKQVMIRRE